MQDNSCTSAGIGQWSSTPLYLLYDEYANMVQQQLLRADFLDAASAITKVNIWVQRKQIDSANLFKQQDTVSFYNWNLVAMHLIQVHYAEDKLVALALARMNETCIARILRSLEYTPPAVAATKLWDAVSGNLFVQEPEASALRILLGCNIVLQKLTTEHERVLRDPFLRSAFACATGAAGAAVDAHPALARTGRSRLVEAYRAVFAEWERAQPLLYSCAGAVGEAITRLLTERIVRRLAGQLGAACAFPLLQKELLQCADAFAGPTQHTRVLSLRAMFAEVLH
eukprot:TRINITY_DN4490_c0_g1_i4.p1 TRINITY_DN4490_c0_g1~~TRINITY_DN4490_c0_g1_i4.p1  ORF type:complete len:284 (+),score=71.04 TRINITY_DN4490_c0_g1_i4:625-1476(+)